MVTAYVVVCVVCEAHRLVIVGLGKPEKMAAAWKRL